MDRLLDLPDFEPHYNRALRQALEYLDQRFNPIAIVVGGSIVRGNPDPASDLDVFVLHAEPWRQRVQRRFDGTPVEFFVNHPSFIAGYFADERARGRPSTAHILATGHLVLDTDGLMAGFIAEAQRLLAAGPDVDDDLLVSHRYATAMEFEDALDVVDRDSDIASMLLHRAVESAVRYCFWGERRWQPRNKELLPELSAVDPDLAMLVRRYYRTAGIEVRLELARKIVLQTAGEIGAFDWESPRDPLDEERRNSPATDS